MTTYYHENTTEIIEDIDTTLIDPGINKVYFFGIEPYITYGYDIEDWREPLEYITSRNWKEMEEDDKYEYLWKIGIMDKKRFAQLISL
jgi:hypothetical protein